MALAPLDIQKMRFNQRMRGFDTTEVEGFLVLIAGLLPAWAIDQHLVTTENYADRYGLPAMFGASLFLASVSGIFLRRRHQIILICLLIGLGAGFHFRLENNFRYAWERQTRLAWQMRWRMPGL